MMMPDNTGALDIQTPQSNALIGEPFQQTLIDNISAALLRDNPPPCLLRAPTGSGKTFILSRCLGDVSAHRPVVWFWFVPFTSLIQQTLNTLVTNARDLAPVQLGQGINQLPQAGQVLISTLQGVSRQALRRHSYDAGGGESLRTLAEFVGLCHGYNLEIGLVVDEAHIALDEQTEFGQFVQWLNPRYITLSSATPRNQRINQFLASAGRSSFETFNVSRDDVVQARLNKAYVEAVIYQLRESTATVADLERTVLRQAWRRNQHLQSLLDSRGIDLTPLLLVQVDNGAGTVEKAERDLVELCGVNPRTIGKHASDTPDPQMMDQIANDPTIRVLIFKQSAGTGFDAPRAFVLASLKSVSDPDFAMQFIGRVMRVSAPIRSHFQHTDEIEPELNTAHIYLANAEAQKGFQDAVEATQSVHSSLEGEVEKMVQGRTRGGATVLTNRRTRQPEIDSGVAPLPGDTSQQASQAPSPQLRDDDAADTFGSVPTETGSTAGEGQSSLFDEQALDTVDPASTAASKRRPHPSSATTLSQWYEALRSHDIRAYTLNHHLQNLPTALKRESRPMHLDMANISQRVATRVPLTGAQLKEAVRAARDRLTEQELHTNLASGKLVQKASAHIVVDRNRVAREASATLGRLPQIEGDDHRIILETLAGRVRSTLDEQLQDSDEHPSDHEYQRLQRTAAQWLVRVIEPELEQALYSEIADHAPISDAAELPHAMLFPQALTLPHSPKNIYGILPPDQDALAEVEHTLMLEDRALLRDRQWQVGDQLISAGQFDSSFALNGDELAFARALDNADFVYWWFRNPDKKPYSVRLVRGEHHNYFYPDFVVCLSHVDGQSPAQRLIETKHDLKDARRKARHVPDFYGKVLFLTRDRDRFRIVDDNGGIGEQVELDSLEAMRTELQRTAP